MANVTRKELLKGGLAGAAAVAAFPFANSTVFASEGGHVALHIHARVSGAPGSFDVNVDVAGKKEALSGSGWDSPNADGANQRGACLSRSAASWMATKFMSTVRSCSPTTLQISAYPSKQQPTWRRGT